MKLIYGQNIDVKAVNAGRFENCLKFLEIDFTKEDKSDSDVSTAKNFKLPEPQPTSTVTENESQSATKPPMAQKRSSPSQTKYKESSKGYEPPKRSRQSETSQEKEEEDIYDYLETCFVTTESGLKEELEKIDFKLLPSSSKKKHNEYICCHCEARFKALNLAKSHFASYHRKNEEEIKILKESILYNDKVGKDITFLQESLQGDFNKMMVICQLETKVHDLERRVTILKNLKEKNLGFHHMQKRDYLIDMFTKKITKVKDFIKIVDK